MIDDCVAPRQFASALQRFRLFACQDQTIQDKTRQGTTQYKTIRQCKKRQDETKQDKTRQGETTTRQDKTCQLGGPTRRRPRHLLDKWGVKVRVNKTSNRLQTTD
jgi:hypothetical protein